MKRIALAVGALALSVSGALASSPDAWAELEEAAKAACIAASGLDEPEIDTPVTNFERHVFVVVHGKWPASSEAAGRVTDWACLYDKELGSAEAREPGFP
ncbi:MAG: hypothetical protein KF895_12570 [Parvibaculum sp.]|nr:hypothetical protein [Parvibaculum sp.]